MKKWMAFLLCFLLTVAAALPAWAQTEEERMLLAVKERIGDTREYDSFDSSILETEQGKTFRFRWQGESKFLYLTVNQEEVITEYRKYSWDEGEKDSLYFDRPSVDQAMERAEQLLAGLNPELEFTLSYDSDVMDLYSDQFQFLVQRTHEGIPVIGDQGYLAVTLAVDGVREFSIHYTPGLSFESEQPLISREEAGQLYGQKLAPQLFYVQETGNTRETEKGPRRYLPVYRLGDERKYISATDGQVVEDDSEDRSYYSNLKGDQAEGAASSSGLTPEELGHFDELEVLLSKEKLEKSLRENKLLSIDSSLPLNSLERHISFDHEYYYFLCFGEEEEWDKGADASVNAKTGELNYFYEHRYWSIREQLTHDQQAESKVFQKLSQRVGEFRYDQEAGRFVRYHGEIPFEGDYAEIFLDDQGKVVYYSLVYGIGEIRSAQDVISTQQAAGLLLEQRDYTLHYLPAEGTGKLVYALEDRPDRIDAFTGEVGYDWEQSRPEKAVYTDLEGHYAQEAAEALAAYGIGFESGEFHPEQTITLGEFGELLYCAFMRPVVEKDAVEQWMRRQNLIAEEEDPASDLSRKRAASMLVTAMGYGEVAGLQGIYLSPFSDITEDAGPIAILSAMKIICGNGDGMFYPEQSITRGEAVVLLYRYLSQK